LDDISEIAGTEEAGDVFEKSEGWTYPVDALKGFGPEVSLVVGSLSFSGC
jgi:hypothetical protein